MKVMMPSSSTPDTEKTMTALLRLRVPGVVRSPCVNLYLVMRSAMESDRRPARRGHSFPKGDENQIQMKLTFGFSPSGFGFYSWKAAKGGGDSPERRSFLDRGGTRVRSGGAGGIDGSGDTPIRGLLQRAGCHPIANGGSRVCGAVPIFSGSECSPAEQVGSGEKGAEGLRVLNYRL
jgi:hypothetical protein